MMKRFLFVLLWSTVLGLAATGHNDDGGWSRPQYLGAGWFPDIVADAAGQLHVVWVGGSVGAETQIEYDLVVYTTSADGTNWLEGNDIIARPQTGGAEATRPSLLPDRSGWLHLMFRDVVIHYARAPLTQAMTPEAWQLEPLSAGYYSTLAQDSAGGLHLVYSRKVGTATCPLCYHIFYQARPQDSSVWYEAVDVSRLSTGSAKPQLQINPDNQLFLLWEAGEGGSQGQLFDPTTVMFNTSGDGGESWGMPTQLSPLEHSARYPGLGQDGQGNLMAVWLDNRTDLVYYRVSQDRGRGWTPTALIPDVYGGWNIYPSRLDHYVMATDSLGHIHLIMVGRNSLLEGKLSLLHLTWDGAGWSSPEQIATYEGDVPEWPEVTIALGNQLHVVWFVRPEAFIWLGGKNSQVWYAQRPLNAPPAVPVLLPAMTQTPTQTAADTLPSVTLRPAASPSPDNSPAAWSGTTPEIQLARFVFQSAGPAFILIIAVIFGVRRASRRR